MTPLRIVLTSIEEGMKMRIDTSTGLTKIIHIWLLILPHAMILEPIFIYYIYLLRSILYGAIPPYYTAIYRDTLCGHTHTRILTYPYALSRRLVESTSLSAFSSFPCRIPNRSKQTHQWQHVPLLCFVYHVYLLINAAFVADLAKQAKS